ncbi:MAG: SDR family oxidoreductase [Bauldia sp.]|uniref:SDR family NAD(P)-dependent oxidoreductase n=1 Tax=Bauldia sp. TaxID=2575872 RepID=UPI001D3A3866|nr:SDR family oxidoreductase [Bauldia sp.]MCB1495641.1 SDR family oxidoreductase [Bauldia sp.]
MNRFEGKVAIVTGGASGQGEAACRLFAAEGASVIVADWNGEGAERVATEVGGLAIRTDVSREADIIAMISLAETRFGRLDVLFNNAGVGHSETARFKMASIVETPGEDWDNILAINLKGCAMGCKHAIPLMVRGGGGSIVNNASIMGIAGVTGADAYSAAKGGMISLTRVLAVEWIEKGIRVNCICPGPVATGMTAEMMETEEGRRNVIGLSPANRVATSEEVARVAVFLASDDASFVNGVILPVDGGWAAL